MIRSIAPASDRWWRGRRVLPGFRLTLGFTLTYLGLLVLIPLAGLVVRTAGLSAGEFLRIVGSERALAAYRLTLTSALMAALINGVFGSLLAWVLVRYRFPGRQLLDALVDLPLALPTAVAGITFTTLYGPKGWLGQPFTPFGLKIAYAPPGIVLVLIFVSLPLVVRTLQPVLSTLDRELEEAAATLGASRSQIIRRVIVPLVLPAWLTGIALAVARSLGEYGSVIFIAGNLPLRTEIAPLLIVIQLEQFNYAGASAIALVLLVLSLLLVGLINLLGRWSHRYG